jgi:hypothetical protein
MANSRTNRRRRERLWADDPRCFWCRKFTHLEPRYRVRGVLVNTFATDDHLYARNDARRREWPVHVLACHGCNQDRNQLSPEAFRLALADRYYRACSPNASPSSPWSAASYLKILGLYDRDEFLTWAHHAMRQQESTADV